MSKREREQVVELLRCAADLYQRGYGGALSHASDDLRLSDNQWHAALQVFDGVCARGSDDIVRDYLEAAARVEEGSWP